MVDVMHGGGRHMVVIVDDDGDVRDSLRFLLETAGYNVEAYGSARQCLDGFDPDDVACLIVDQHMPELTGLEFLGELHRRGALRPAMLITGSPTPDLIRRAEGLDGTKVLSKPLAEDALLRFIEASVA